MTGIYGNSAEDRHFESALYNYLDGQDDTARKEFIEQAVEGYLADEYFPFKSAHVSEAMNELGNGQLAVMASYLHTANKLTDNEFAQASATQVMLMFIKDYWTKQATAQAEKDWENRE